MSDNDIVQSAICSLIIMDAWGHSFTDICADSSQTVLDRPLPHSDMYYV